MSGKRKSVQHSMQGVFVFVLLGLFALMSTLMVLLGAQMYRGTVSRSTANNEDRVLAAYVRSMVRAQDAPGAVRVEELEGIPVLALHEQIEDLEYVTWIYCYEGQVYEQFTEAQYEFHPEFGTAIAPAERFAPSLEDGLLSVEIVDADGQERTVQVALRCELEGTAPAASVQTAAAQTAPDEEELIEFGDMGPGFAGGM